MNTKITNVIDKFKEVFSLDLRSLALLRIGVGVVGLADIVLRCRDLVAHYGDGGALPRGSLLSLPYLNNFFGSVNFISGLWQFQLVIFILAAGFFISLILGYKTRWATLFVWILLMSIQARNPLVFQKSDDVLRLLLLWGFFLPWGSMYSLDSSRNVSIKNQSKSVFSVATFAYFVQIMLIYITAALLKSSFMWHQEGSAIFYALSNDQYTTTLGYFLLSLPSWALQFLTHSVWWFELLGTVFLILPVFNPLFRMIGVVLFIGLQAGFGSTMHLEIFPWICSAAMFAFIPGAFWEWLYLRLPFKKQRELTLYYDDDCGFCRRSIRNFKTFLFLPDMEVIAGGQSSQISLEMEDKNSWIVVRNAEHFYRFDAFAALLSASPVFWPLGKLAKFKIVKVIGEKLYTLVASRRRRTCPVVLPRPKSFFEKLPPVSLQIVAAFFLFIVVFWNVSNITYTRVSLPKGLQSIGYLFGLNQRWDMFAPYPMTVSYWYIMPGHLRDNSSVDVLANKPVSWDKPKSIATITDSRWRNYLLQLFGTQNTTLYAAFGNYVCQQWNKSHIGNKQLNNFEVYIVSRQNAFNQPPPPYKRTLLRQYRCVGVAKK